MKLRKILSFVCASAMVMSLAACTSAAGGKTAASVDFEDGKYGFVLMNTDSKTADASVLSVKDLNGSKVLYAENQGSAITKIGVDLTALLGDNVANLATVEFQLGTDAATFAACSGKIYGNFGEKTNVELSSFSVYLADKNPITVSVSVSDLKAGEKNYIVINRSEDLGATPSSMFIDNIVLKDADGKLLTANTDGVFDAPEGYAVDWSQITADVVSLDVSYPGDWSASSAIPAEALEAYTEKGVKVTLDVLLSASCDNLCCKPIGADWSLVDTLADADGNNVGGFGDYVNEDCPEGDHNWHLKLDGVMHTTDLTDTKLTFHLAGDTVARLIELGGLMFQVNGVTVTAATLEQPAEAVVVDRSNAVEMPACYPGDWSGVNSGLVIPFDKMAVGAEVVVDIVVIDAGKFTDSWKVCPFNADGWGKLTQYVTDSSIKTTEGGGEESFFEPTLEDTQIKFTISQEMYDIVKASVDANADGWGGLGFQVNGVGVTKVTVDGEEVFVFVETEPVPVPDNYVGDWSADEQITAAGIKEGDKVTLDVTVLTDGYDYWLITPIDAAWAKIPAVITDCSADLNDAGDFFALTAETTQITFTVTADLASQIFGFQVYGVCIDNITIE